MLVPMFLGKLVSPSYKTQLNIPPPIRHTAGASSIIMVDQKPNIADSSSVSELSNNGRVIMITTPNIQPPVNPSFASELQDLSKQKAETVPPSNIIVVHGPSQGINAIAASPQMAVPKPKTQPAATSVVVKLKAKQDGGGGGGGGHQDNSNHKYTDYIEYVKNQLGTKSNVGEEATLEKQQPTRIPTARRDSFNDRASNFVMRTKNNINKTNRSQC